MDREEPSLKMKYKQLKTILIKDIKSELRQFNDLISIFLFGITSIFIFSSSYNLVTQNQVMSLELFVIQIWFIIFFLMMFIMTKLFIKEQEAGTLSGLISSPVSSNTLIFSKILFCFIILSLVELVILLFAFFISVPSIQNFDITQYILLGVLLPTLNLSVCGTIISAFSMYAKNKSLILPILFFPLIFPIINPIISINIKLLEGAIFFDIIFEFLFLIFHVVLTSSILILVSDGLLSN
ncbi:MAG: heme exporter protein CcmB [Candidatus Lokiarchaeota archaeon]|nr:heme exporter protein CcmB [Candidatus Lokiarchaeota archaeon]